MGSYGDNPSINWCRISSIHSTIFKSDMGIINFYLAIWMLKHPHKDLSNGLPRATCKPLVSQPAAALTSVANHPVAPRIYTAALDGLVRCYDVKDRCDQPVGLWRALFIGPESHDCALLLCCLFFLGEWGHGSLESVCIEPHWFILILFCPI